MIGLSVRFGTATPRLTIEGGAIVHDCSDDRVHDLVYTGPKDSDEVPFLDIGFEHNGLHVFPSRVGAWEYSCDKTQLSPVEGYARSQSQLRVDPHFSGGLCGDILKGAVWCASSVARRLYASEMDTSSSH